MIINAYKLENIEEFSRWVAEMSDYSLFRGHGNSQWKLITSYGRIAEKYNLKDDVERKIYSEFRKRVRFYLDKIPGNDFDWLVLAQHHGLPTRLLDWSRNPLVALYFAVENEDDNDGCVFALKKYGNILGPTSKYLPYKIKGVVKVFPYYLNERQASQHGCFTVHGNPKEPYNHTDIYKIRICAKDKPIIKRRLLQFGISRGSLFPGIDGIASDVCQIIHDLA